MYGFMIPEDFILGTANSAFQSEGAQDRDGRSESMMEYYAREFAGKYKPGLDPEVAKAQGKLPYSTELCVNGCFFYDNYEAYIEDMKKTGQDAFRMSLSWPRIIPTGVGQVNPKGIEFYNKVIDKLLSCGIKPFVDLYHWDLPQCLQEKGGFANPEFPQWYEDFARVCFENFGDRVAFWSTFNEPDIFVRGGHWSATFPPFISDIPRAIQSGHNVVLAHVRAVRLYRQMGFTGQIGTVNCTSAIQPARMVPEDVDAVAYQYMWRFDWYIEPMIRGCYPQRLIDEVPAIRENMPANYQEELDRWFAPMDFIGLNYYIPGCTKYDPKHPVLSSAAPSFYTTPGQWNTPYPVGMLDVLQYIQARYGDVPVFITENGCSGFNKHDPEVECEDEERVMYLREHVRMLVRCIRAGINLKGYFYWNDADSYEELDGYNQRFGLTWVDQTTGERRWKKSRYFFSDICKTRMVN